jgi:hypothetical protein
LRNSGSAADGRLRQAGYTRPCGLPGRGSTERLEFLPEDAAGLCYHLVDSSRTVVLAVEWQSIQSVASGICPARIDECPRSVPTNSTRPKHGDFSCCVSESGQSSRKPCFWCAARKRVACQDDISATSFSSSRTSGSPPNADISLLCLGFS